LFVKSTKIIIFFRVKYKQKINYVDIKGWDKTELDFENVDWDDWMNRKYLIDVNN
jgi:hypothetical protein